MVGKTLFVTVLALVLLAGPLVHPESIDYLWERFPFFEAAFGFVGCLAIIFVSKALGRLFIQKKEDYYDEEHRDDK